jgi:hypothetical protein
MYLFLPVTHPSAARSPLTTAPATSRFARRLSPSCAAGRKLAGVPAAEEQVTTWGLDAFWGLPHYPRTPYYRTYKAPVGADAHLYEFVAPMVPPSWNDRQRVSLYAASLAAGATPTAVAVSIRDVCAPAVDHGVDYHAHWALTHFLLDGHHKIHAAAEAARPLQLLSLLSLDASLGSPEQVAQIPALRSVTRARRRYKNRERRS